MMPMSEVTPERFAKWTQERDLKIFGESLSSWDDYMDEAKFYMRKPIEAWPCGVLVQMGSHLETHPECTDQSVDQ